MKNLKQVLALGMAFSLSLSTLASAAFTDQDSISKQNADAVELLTTLDIIQGYEDGSFRPENTVTRAQMAKMIYTIRNGGNDNADAYKSVTTSFDDIQGHWAEGYIKYLQNTDIVAGKSETKFRPDQTVTTAEAMKMALVLGGYTPDKAGLEGAEWLNNTVSLATTNKLTKDVVSPMAGACTRQDAAQILANALGMTAVQWNEFVGGFVNDSDSGLAIGGEKITVGYKWMDLTTYIGTLEASGDFSIGDGGAAGNNQFRVDVDTKNDKKYEGGGAGGTGNKGTTVTFKDGKDHTDLVGQEVKVLTGDKIDEVYGVYPTGTSQVVETTMDKVEVDDKNDKLIVDGNKYSIDFDDSNNTAVYADGKSAKDTVSSIFSANGKVTADKVKMIDEDNNGKYETIIVETASVAKVTYVGTESITVGQVGSRDDKIVGSKKNFENSEMNIYDGAAKGDYVVITRDDYNQDKWNVEKATVVTGTVDGVVRNDQKVRVDGTWYTLANDKTSSTPEMYTIPGGVENFANKDSVTLYVVGDVVYYAESTKGNDANRQVAMVYDTTKSSSNDDEWGGKVKKAKVLLADGSKKTVNVSDDGISYDKLVNGKVYTYKVNNDGDYIFSEVNVDDGKKVAGYDFAVSDKDGVDNGNKYGGKYVIADDAVVFTYINDDTDAVMYTGKQIKDLNRSGFGTYANGVAFIEKSNNFEYTRMMSISIKKNDKLNSTSNYGYLITDATSSNKDGVDIMEYSFWNGSEVVNAIEKTSTNKEEWATKGTIISFNNDGEGQIKDVDATTSLKGIDKLHYAAMTGVDGKNVALIPTDDVETTLEVDSDTKFIYVNSDAKKDSGIGVEGEGYEYDVSENSDGTYNVNVAYVATNDGKVKFMVIDVDGELLVDGKKQTVKPETMSNDKVNEELAKGDVTLYGNQTLTGIDVPAGKTLTINGDLTIDTTGTAKQATAGEFKVAGNLVVRGNIYVTSTAKLDLASTAKVTVAKSVDVAKEATLNLESDAKMDIGDKFTGTGKLTGDGAEGGITVGGEVYKTSPDALAKKVTK